jgi:hypothetical protein
MFKKQLQHLHIILVAAILHQERKVLDYDPGQIGKLKDNTKIRLIN